MHLCTLLSLTMMYRIPNLCGSLPHRKLSRWRVGFPFRHDCRRLVPRLAALPPGWTPNHCCSAVDGVHVWEESHLDQGEGHPSLPLGSVARALDRVRSWLSHSVVSSVDLGPPKSGFSTCTLQIVVLYYSCRRKSMSLFGAGSIG